MRAGLVDVLGWTFIAIVGFVLGLMIVFASLVGWFNWIRPVASLPPLEVVVDRSLNETEAWVVGRTDLPKHPAGAAWVEVETRSIDESSIEVLVKKRWGPYGDDLGFRIAFRTGAPPSIVATGNVGGLRFGEGWPDESLGGTIRVSSMRPPSDNEDLILTYDLVMVHSYEERLSPAKLVLRANDFR